MMEELTPRPDDPLGLRSLTNGLEGLADGSPGPPTSYEYTVQHLGNAGAHQVWAGVTRLELHPAGVVFEDRDGREVYLINVPIKVIGKPDNGGAEE